MEKISSIPVVPVSPSSIDDDGSKLIKANRMNQTDTAVAVNKLIKIAKGIDARVSELEAEVIPLTDLSDVIIDTPTDGQLLTFETSSGQWKNKTKAEPTPFWNNFPIGWINQWYGTLANIPAGWQNCDGTNGTPDLRDRVIVGAGSTYAKGATGGANTHTLSAAEMPSHVHSNGCQATTGMLQVGDGYGGTVSYTGPSIINTGSAGSGNAHNNMQAFCAVYNIMKVS